MKLKILIILIFLLGIKNYTNAQDYNNRWAVSIGAAGLLYSESDGPAIGFRYSPQFPRLSLARYMFPNVTFAGSLSASIEEGKKYTTLDGEIRYDFGTSENTLSIYSILGGSLVESKDYVAPFINLGLGGTLWISDRFGLNGQMIYKIDFIGLSLQASHIYASGGLVYRFSLGSNSYSTPNIRKDRRRKRLWEMKH